MQDFDNLFYVEQYSVRKANGDGMDQVFRARIAGTETAKQVLISASSQSTKGNVVVVVWPHDISCHLNPSFITWGGVFKILYPVSWLTFNCLIFKPHLKGGFETYLAVLYK